jgi:hypothetical protein
MRLSSLLVRKIRKNLLKIKSIKRRGRATLGCPYPPCNRRG